MGSGKIKVLEVNIDDQGNGGVYSLIKNVIESKPDNLKIDIAALEPFDKKENIKHLKDFGTDVYYVGYNGNKLKKQHVIYKNMVHLLKKNKYDVVHIHADVANKLLVSGLAAKKCGVPKIILHSHATGTDGNNRELKEKIHKLCRQRLAGLGAEYAACSYAAAKWMFPGIRKEDVTIIKNGIDLDKYRYNPEIRKKTRDRLGLSDEDFLIGHVGRFMYQKNHEYIIDVFDTVCKKWSDEKRKGNVKLLLVGDGELVSDIKKKVKAKGLEDRVIFYGLSNKVNELLQAMDAFILPSHFEGLPIVGIEAQAAGLPILLSNKITKETRLVKAVKFLTINEKTIDLWVEVLLKIKDNYIRKDTINILMRKGYGIDSTVDYLIELYTNETLRLGNGKSLKRRLSDDEVKDAIYDILCSFADYCDENGLRYTLCGGTLIGAVRHKGFIPWDDDIDVFMSRPDYNRLHELVKVKPIGKNYRLDSFQNGRIDMPFAKVVDTTTSIEEKYFVHDSHLWIDIFPVDGMPESENDSKRIFNEIMKLKRYVGWSQARPGTGSTKLRALARSIAIIIPKIRGTRYYSSKMDKIARRLPYDYGNYAASVVWAVNYGERMKRSDYEKTVELDFCDRKFHAPGSYKEYLTGMYGDYMKLPPAEKRQTHSITAYKKCES